MTELTPNVDTRPETRPDTRRTLFLAQSSSPVEAKTLEEWTAEQRTALVGQVVEIVAVPFPRDRAGDEALGRSLLAHVDSSDDPLLVPIRVAWLPKERDGQRTARLIDVVVVGDPRRPHRLAQEMLSRRSPDRLQVVTGGPALLSDLREAWEQTDPDDLADRLSFARFVGRRATLALEREESHRLGPHYKVPRLVREEVAASARFRSGIRRMAGEVGEDEAAVAERAGKYLDEMVTGFGSTQIDITMQMGKMMYKRGYDPQLDIDEAQVAKVRLALDRHAGVVLPTHRSNLDAGVMPATFHEMCLPKTHTLAGINMAFWPLAPLMRRSGVIYIRRDTKDDALYRWVLREYVGYLVEKRFHLEWYIEGGRSRTGKLLPPKLGLLTYVVDAYREGRADDVMLIPASMTYDQLQEVKDYTAEAHGSVKKPENAAWFLRYARSLRGNYGKIYVRFGEPVSLREALGPPAGLDSPSRDQHRLALQKLGFEVSWRINNVTPITAISLISMALLSADDQALTAPQLAAALERFLVFAEERGLPLTDSARRLRSDAGMRSALEALIDQNVVVEAKGRYAVYAIAPGQHLSASFYRNAVLHFLLNAAIGELALVAASEAPQRSRVEAFWDAAMWLRDTLKFDFFFLEKDQFRADLAAEMARTHTAWEHVLTSSSDGAMTLLGRRSPITGHTALRSFFEAYHVVVRTVQWRGIEALRDKKSFLGDCEGLGRQYLMQRRISRSEAVTRLLFETGMQLVENRAHASIGGSSDGQPGRSAAPIDLLASELQAVLRRLGIIEQVARQRFAKTMDELRYTESTG